MCGKIAAHTGDKWNFMRRNAKSPKSRAFPAWCARFSFFRMDAKHPEYAVKIPGFTEFPA